LLQRLFTMAIALDGTDLCAWSNLALATQVGLSA
jgi:hypothetical protein